MKTLALMLIAVTLAGTALAKDTPLSVVFDDAGFVYYDEHPSIYDDSGEGYIQLAYADDVLTVQLHPKSNPQGVKLDFDEIADLSDERRDLLYDRPSAGMFRFTQGRLRAKEQDRLRELAGVTVHRTSLSAYSSADDLEIKHDDADLTSMMSAYDDMLSDLGFSRTPESSTVNRYSYVYQNGEGRARVVFSRLGNVITVRIQAL